MPDYAKPLEESGKVVGRYHIVGYHGGAWFIGGLTAIAIAYATRPTRSWQQS